MHWEALGAGSPRDFQVQTESLPRVIRAGRQARRRIGAWSPVETQSRLSTQGVESHRSGSSFSRRRRVQLHRFEIGDSLRSFG